MTLICCVAQVLDPPPRAATEAAVSQLKQLGALSAAEDLTPLGHHLALLPLDIRLGKVLIYGAMLRCVHTHTHTTHNPIATAS